MRNLTGTILALVAAAGLTLATGCKSDCEKAFDNTMSILEGELGKAEGPEKEMLQKMVDEGKKAKDKQLEECAKEKPEVVKCMAEAKSKDDMAKCHTAK